MAKITNPSTPTPEISTALPEMSLGKDMYINPRIGLKISPEYTAKFPIEWRPENWLLNCLVSRSSRLVCREELLVDLVHFAIVGNVLQENGAFDHIVEAAACSPFGKSLLF